MSEPRLQTDGRMPRYKLCFPFTVNDTPLQFSTRTESLQTRSSSVWRRSENCVFGTLWNSVGVQSFFPTHHGVLLREKLWQKGMDIPSCDHKELQSSDLIISMRWTPPMVLLTSQMGVLYAQQQNGCMTAEYEQLTNPFQ